MTKLEPHQAETGGLDQAGEGTREPFGMDPIAVRVGEDEAMVAVGLAKEVLLGFLGDPMGEKQPERD